MNHSTTDGERLLPYITAHNAAVEEVSALLLSSKINPGAPMHLKSLEASKYAKIKVTKDIRKLHKSLEAVYDEYTLILQEWNEKHRDGTGPLKPKTTTPQTRKKP